MIVCLHSEAYCIIIINYYLNNYFLYLVEDRGCLF